MAKGDDIQERLIDFAVMVIKVSAELPKGFAGRHISKQLLRSGTSSAPNYAEARSAESNNDFIHKLKIALKELNETKVWLKISRKSGLLAETRMKGISSECDELCKIISVSVRTARTRRE